MGHATRMVDGLPVFLAAKMERKGSPSPKPPPDDSAGRRFRLPRMGRNSDPLFSLCQICDTESRRLSFGAKVFQSSGDSLFYSG